MNKTIINSKKNLVEPVESLGRWIGETPLYPLHSFSSEKVKIYAKLEWQQLGGSVKTRPAYNMIKQGILSGDLAAHHTILDATSGNTGIALATIAAHLGLKIKLVLPENASKMRQLILKKLGVDLVLSSPYGGTDESREVAREIYATMDEPYFYIDQYNNENNWKAHFNGTGPEIWRQSSGAVTHFIAGLGTTGSFTGTTRRLKQLNPLIQCIALQPDGPLHGLEGWKHLETAEIPGIYDASLPDQILEVSSYDAFKLIDKVAKQEGLLISPSAAANLAGAIQVANTMEQGHIVTLFADDASKYQEIYK
ncbi:MAG: PLP-dependent cysteine synthase family protein [Saprospiraceae bacterium]|jgi:cysteine synthase B|nr:PLP-dependent cysteine synthase family protein [Saprospiraceae bacterium]MBK6478661.1 PLP-dependent cysteine synthase family protein [Saprospiraceae bacterium]MBK6814154.1 PLP-dependent cysteine synthase family protein [Saprospiraceae bacterium]MBK7373597.1 PLP-dependent cysteine synthase family protein [Saprospiraceae bacterium]MBK7437268.1 PLP-dependent cysteine synthase family protein [Saprospiraceae bacterium]